MKVLIRNNTLSVHGIVLPRPNGGMDYVTLLPGVNDVESEQWAECMKNGAVTDRVEARLYDVVSSEDASISGVKEKAAIALVGETVIESLLLAWQKAEKRPRVRAAIKAQLALISVGPEKSEKEV
jgi:hypothetical protein